MTVTVGTEPAALEDLTPYPGNARRGNVDLILDSLRANGQYKPLVVRRQGEVLTILAGNHTYLALLRHEEVREACVDWELTSNRPCELCVNTDKDDPATLVHIIECDDATAARINLVDNKAADAGGYDDEALAAILSGLEDDFTGTGYSDEDHDSVAARAAGPAWEAGQAQELAEASQTLADGPQAAPGRTLARHVPLDAIFSMGRFCSITLAAYEMGFQPGIVSTSLGAARHLKSRLPDVRLGFMDNEWHDYDHAKHVAAVAETKPKYATVRDVMTKAQCEAAGIDFYPLEQILEMAAEVGEHADHVIVIPKYDCIAKIPEEYVVGFSVPTSYGGTPMPAESLRGRRVHLLGGSWTNQRRYLAILGDDVVSFDNNHLLRVSEFGQFNYHDGTDGRFSTLDLRVPDRPPLPRTWQAAATLSLAAIRDDLNATFATLLDPLVDGEAPTASQPRSEDSDG